MSTLVVIGYDNEFKAEEVRLTFRKLQKEYLIDLEDAVVAVKDANGKVNLHQAINLTAAGAVGGGFWGSLIGLIFLNPLLGAAVGAAAGAASGALSNVGINDKFMKELADNMSPGTSALFVLVQRPPWTRCSMNSREQAVKFSKPRFLTMTKQSSRPL